MRLWDPVDGTAVGDPLPGHTGRVSALAVVPAPDGGSWLASAGYDGMVRLWDVATHAPPPPHCDYPTPTPL